MRGEQAWADCAGCQRGWLCEHLVAHLLKCWRPLQVQESEGAFASPIEVEEREEFSLPPPAAEVQTPFSSSQAAHQLCLHLALRGLSGKASGIRMPACVVQRALQGLTVWVRLRW